MFVVVSHASAIPKSPQQVKSLLVRYVPIAYRTAYRTVYVPGITISKRHLLTVRTYSTLRTYGLTSTFYVNT